MGIRQSRTIGIISVPGPESFEKGSKATESCLETYTLAVEVVLPFPLSESANHGIVSATSAVSLKMPAAHNLPSGIWAALFHGIGEHKSGPHPDQIKPTTSNPQLILTIRYIQAALTALISDENLE